MTNTPDDLCIFPEKLKSLRKQKNWSQKDLARELGVSEDAIKDWEGGRTVPNFRNRQELCKLFEMSPEALGLVAEAEGFSQRAVGLQSPSAIKEQIQMLEPSVEHEDNAERILHDEPKEGGRPAAKQDALGPNVEQEEEGREGNTKPTEGKDPKGFSSPSPTRSRRSSAAWVQGSASKKRRQNTLSIGLAAVLLLVIACIILLLTTTSTPGSRSSYIPPVQSTKPEGPKTLGNTLYPNTSLLPNQQLMSNNHEYTLLMRENGHLIEYDNGKFFWGFPTSGPPGAFLRNQDDGNIVLLRPDGTPIKGIDTEGYQSVTLEIQDDGNIVAYAQGHIPIKAKKDIV